MLKYSLTGAILVFCGSASGQLWSDDFNRPDGPIGGDWTETSGVWGVNLTQGVHVSLGVNDILTHNQASIDYQDAVYVLEVYAPGTASQFSAILIGLGGADTIQVKIQDQVPTTPGFSHIGIYHRTGAATWGPWTGVGTGFQALAAPFMSGGVTVHFPDLDTIVVEIDTDFNGTPDQVYTKTGVTSIASGIADKHGIGAWGNTARFDNWLVASIVPPCYPDCNGDSILNLADFGCFQTKFATANMYADCNGDQLLNLADFGCFQTKFALGCP